MPKKTKFQKRHAEINRTQQLKSVSPAVKTENSSANNTENFKYSLKTAGHIQPDIHISPKIHNEFTSVRYDLIKTALIALTVLILEAGLVWKLGYL